MGANVGAFTLFVNHKRKNLDVYAFEPILPTFGFLETNVALYSLKAKLFNLGISSANGTAEFTFYPRMPGLSGRYSNEGQEKRITKSIIEDYLRREGTERERAILNDDELNQLMEEYFKHETYTCSLTTLSDIIREHGIQRIDLLKIDVEKSEFDVLSGLHADDWPKIRQIVMEVDTPQLLAQISTLLEQQGFNFTVDEVINVAEVGAADEVHIYMLYATRRVETETEMQLVASKLDAEPQMSVNGSELSVDKLRQYLRDKLPGYMVPSAFILLPRLPLTPNGKIDLRALPERLEFPSEMELSDAAPETKAEHIVAQVWREVLKLEQVGVNANFFEVGGTSLLLVQVNSKLREAFKKSIAIVEMFRHPTISTLARYLEAGEGNQPSFERAQERAIKGAEALSQQRRAMQARQRKSSPNETGGQ